MAPRTYEGCGVPRPLFVRSADTLGFGQASSEDPHELRRRRRAHLGPGVRQVVVHGRVRQAAEELTARTYPVGGPGSRCGSDQRAVMA
jgi:hypothetical protein